MKIHELGHVVFYVKNLETSADFYKNILGFNEIHRDTHTAMFSSGRTHHELFLIEVGGEIKEKSFPSPGLYHIGFKIGSSDDELRQAIKELEESGIDITGMGDHTVTHSIYILDPDQNEIELYIDVDEEWKSDPTKIVAPTKALHL